MEGRVLGGTNPLGGATVTAFDADTGTAVRSTTADTGGNYRLGALPVGAYKVRAAKTGWATGWANYPTGISKATATVFFLSGGQVLTQTWNPANLYINLSPESVVDGGVLGINSDYAGGNGWDDPLDGVTITAFDADTGTVVSSATTDREGEYLIGGLAEGSYKLRAAKPGWVPVWDVATTAPELSAHVHFTIYAEAVMEGRVFGGTNPLGDATVTAFNADTGAAVRSTTADTRGYYRLGALPFGNYKVRAAKAGWATGWANYPTGISKATATVFRVYAGQVLTQTWNPANLYLNLSPESVIWGDVLGINADRTGGNGWDDPLPGVTITAFDADTGTVVSSATTNAEGGYHIGGLNEGSYKIRAAKPGWLTVWDVAATAPGYFTRVHFTIYAEAVMEGKVLGRMVPLGGATVTAFNADTGAAVRSTIADTRGNYRLGALPAGNYKVRAAKTGWATGWANYPTGTSKATATVFPLYAGQVLTQTWNPANLYINLRPVRPVS